MAENGGKEDGGGIASKIEELRRQLADAKSMLSAAKEGKAPAARKRPAGARKRGARAPEGPGGEKKAARKPGGPGAEKGEAATEAAAQGRKPGGPGAKAKAGPEAERPGGPEGEKGGPKKGRRPRRGAAAGEGGGEAGEEPEAERPGGPKKGRRPRRGAAAGEGGGEAGEEPEAERPGGPKKGRRPRRGAAAGEGGGEAGDAGPKKPAARKRGKSAEEREREREREKERDRTLEEELESQLTEEEIRNFMLEKHDMSRLTNRVCEILYECEGAGMVQNMLWKKLKLSSKDGARLALKLERRGIIDREKIVEKGRWTYRLILRKSPVSTESIVNAPCLTCPVEARCAVDAEVSPLTCTLLESWVMAPSGKGRSGRR